MLKPNQCRKVCITRRVFIVGLILTSLKDDMVTNYIFTDWCCFDAKQRLNILQARVLTQRIPLLSIDDTESMLKPSSRN